MSEQTQGRSSTVKACVKRGEAVDERVGPSTGVWLGRLVATPYRRWAPPRGALRNLPSRIPHTTASTHVTTPALSQIPRPTQSRPSNLTCGSDAVADPQTVGHGCLAAANRGLISHRAWRLFGGRQSSGRFRRLEGIRDTMMDTEVHAPCVAYSVACTQQVMVSRGSRSKLAPQPALSYFLATFLACPSCRTFLFKNLVYFG